MVPQGQRIKPIYAYDRSVVGSEVSSCTEKARFPNGRTSLSDASSRPRSSASVALSANSSRWRFPSTQPARAASGCAIWIIVTPELVLQSFLWFGSAPGEPLPDISGMRAAKHTKGNAEGIKAERPNHRVVPRSRFEIVPSLDAVLERLFGRLS